MFILYILPLIIGYLLGSLSPAYFLSLFLKGQDIRKLGDKNAGTTNVYHVLGPIPAYFTAIFDLTKGVLALLIAQQLGCPNYIAYLAGFFAVLGHIFPFYLKFKGGKGAATGTGLLLYCLIMMLLNGNWILLVYFIPLGLIALTLRFTIKKGEIISAYINPLLFMIIYINVPLNSLALFALLIILFFIILNLLSFKKAKILPFKPKTKIEILRWRAFLRPLAIVLPFSYFIFDKKIVLIIMGSLFLLSFLFDLIRLISRKANIFLYNQKKIKIFKAKEKKSFSSITLFFLGIFLSILIFPKAIAITVISFTVFGDLASKLAGMQIGQTKIFSKTLEGSLAFFSTCLFIGLLFSKFLPLTPSLIIFGSLVATMAELFPIRINDNFAIPLISGAAMYALQIFFI